MEPVDSPLPQLLSDWPPPDISRLKADVFRERVLTEEATRCRFEEARVLRKVAGVARLRELQRGFGPLDTQPIAAIVDLFLSCRALEAWDDRNTLPDAMPIELRRQILVHEQLAFALNRRVGDRMPPSPPSS